jgi:hypothetical protein
MAPSAAPMPMPAFAPVDSPFLTVAAAVLDVAGRAVLVDALDKTEADVEEAEKTEDSVEEEEMDEDDRSVGTGSPNRAAMVYCANPLPSVQQALVSPQHQVVESASPPQGVTRISVFLCASRCSSSVLLPTPYFDPCQMPTSFEHRS